CLQPARSCECGRSCGRLRNVQRLWRPAAPTVQGRGKPRYPGSSGRWLPRGWAASSESAFRYAQNDVQSAAAANVRKAVVLRNSHKKAQENTKDLMKSETFCVFCAFLWLFPFGDLEKRDA